MSHAHGCDRQEEDVARVRSLATAGRILTELNQRLDQADHRFRILEAIQATQGSPERYMLEVSTVCLRYGWWPLLLI